MGPQHAKLLIDVVVVGTHHATLDGAHVVGVIEGKVGNPAEGAQFLSVVGRPVGFADILDQGDAAPTQFCQQLIGQSVETLDMRKEDRPRPVADFRENLRRVHGQSSRIDINEYRLEAVLQDRGNVGYPGQWRHDDLTAVRMTNAQDRHGQQIGRGAGVYENAVLHPQPLGPLGLEGPHVGRLRKNRIILLQMLYDGIQVFTQDVVSH